MTNLGGGLALDQRQIFMQWSEQKIKLDGRDHPNFYFYEREIWWASLGKNIGHEIDGKHEDFLRPILILKRYSHGLSLVLPITTQIKDVTYQFPIIFNSRKMAVLLEQSRTISTKRLLKSMGKIDEKVFNQIWLAFVNHIK